MRKRHLMEEETDGLESSSKIPKTQIITCNDLLRNPELKDSCCSRKRSGGGGTRVLTVN